MRPTAGSHDSSVQSVSGLPRYSKDEALRIYESMPLAQLGALAHRVLLVGVHCIANYPQAKARQS